MTASEDAALTLAYDDAAVLFDLLQRWIDDEARREPSELTSGMMPSFGR
jgi:hypothetical protein